MGTMGTMGTIVLQHADASCTPVKLFRKLHHRRALRWVGVTVHWKSTLGLPWSM